KVDYKLSDVTIGDLGDIMQGKASDKLPHVIEADSDDNVMVFWCGHGHQNTLAWGSNATVYGKEVRNIIEGMNYRKIFFALDACYSGTIGEACEGLPGVLVMTAANAYEPSKADMKDPEMGIWLSNGFTRAFQEAVDENPNIVMSDLYYKLARQTVGSHATVYNVTHYGNMHTNTVGEFLNP
ncbi:MAG: legumain, partial [Bacteroidaceae bacterium]|nr:legumain [Bacteroidaceae bacterium]